MEGLAPSWATGGRRRWGMMKRRCSGLRPLAWGGEPDGKGGVKLEGDGMNTGERRMPLRYRLAAVCCICEALMFCGVARSRQRW